MSPLPFVLLQKAVLRKQLFAILPLASHCTSFLYVFFTLPQLLPVPLASPSSYYCISQSFARYLVHTHFLPHFLPHFQLHVNTYQKTPLHPPRLTAYHHYLL